jgi:hypothetical protein
MPAIHPARLRQQAALLAEHFQDPPAYVRSLHHLLETYAERAHRPGQAGGLPSLLASYKVRPPVLRLVLLELLPLVEEDPSAGLSLCDALWEEPYLEFRLLASFVLGHIPCAETESITARLRLWIQPGVEPRLLEALLKDGTLCLRRRSPLTLLAFTSSWLEEKELFYQKIGLQLLLPLITDPEYENLPAFYRLIQPLTRSAPTDLRPDLLDVLTGLVKRSPDETAFFLRQTAAIPNSPDTPWIIRQLLRQFPPDLEESLREFSRELVKQHP